MLPFLYSIFLKLLYPTSVSILLLLASAVLRRRHSRAAAERPDSQPSTLNAQLGRVCFWAAVVVLLVCGNGWVVEGLAKNLERQYPPLDLETTDHKLQTTDHRPRTTDQGAEVSSQSSVVGGPDAIADAILVLSGGILPALPPRSTVEIAEAGDRLLYGAHLFREGKAPHIICTGNVATGGIAPRPVAQDMAEFLQLLGIPKQSVITEIKSENTYQHAVQLYPVLKERDFKRVLLVTSALHMPRSIGVFRRQCPSIEFIPAPTDFRVTDRMPAPWYHLVTYLIPTPTSLLLFSEAMHEYLGMAYYRLRGWM